MSFDLIQILKLKIVKNEACNASRSGGDDNAASGGIFAIFTDQTQPPHAEESSRPLQHTQEKSLARLLPQSDTKSFSLADDARKSPRDTPSEGLGNGPRWYSGE